MITVLIVAGLAFLALRLIFFLSSVISTIESGDTAPSAPYTHPDTGYGDSPAEGTSGDPISSAMLRQMLNAQGYEGVQFRLRGSTISLWGKVQSEMDREMVEQEAFTITGAVSLDDHLEVQE